MTARTDALGAVDCPCGHTLLWHDGRGCLQCDCEAPRIAQELRTANRQLELLRRLRETLIEEARGHREEGEHHSARIKIHTAERMRHILKVKP